MMREPTALDRRGFLRLGSAAALGLAVAPAVHTAAADSTVEGKATDPYGGFKLGAQSYTFRHFNTEQALKRMKELRLPYGEFYQKHIPLQSTSAQIRAFRNLCKEYGVTPLAWGVQHFGKDHDANRKVFEFGKALGLKMFSADPTPDSFDSLDKLVEEYGIAIGIHPHGPQDGPQGRVLHRWYSAEVILKAVKDHHKLIGTCLDTGHLIRAAQMGRKLDPAEQIRVMGARNFGIHLKDHDNARHTDVVCGKGALDVPAVLKALREVKFNGLISIEYEAREDNPSPDVAACLQVVKAAVKKLS